ncbi:MAG: hypothetical protein FJ222_12490 [Lentisphaerae bacterium]|nr:hypothetical protein [Lentisphaerota bacterium]
MVRKADDEKIEGWICLHRSLRKHPRYEQSAWVRVWVDLLLHAQHAPTPTKFGGKVIILQPGQLVTGRKATAKRLGLNEFRVERILTTMENEHQIAQEKTHTSRLITILNWCEYQHTAQPSAQPPHNHRTTTAQPPHNHRTLLNNVNNEKNGNNDNTGRGAGEEDAAFRILMGCPSLAGMSYEQYRLVRRGYEAASVKIDWQAAARAVVEDAGLEPEPIWKPALFLKSRLGLFVREVERKNTRAADEEGRWEAPQDARLLAMRAAAKRGSDGGEQK